MKDFYGRKKARKIRSPHLLETLPKDIPNIGPLNLEIGVGSGDFIAQMAQNNPHECFVGCDLYINGLIAAIKKTEHLDNVFLYMENAKIFLDRFAPHALFNIFVLFPDPWPKKRHQKRRLLQKDFLEKLLSKTQNALWIATDDALYKDFITENLTTIPDIEWYMTDEHPQDFPMTAYEKKAVLKNKKSFFIQIVNKKLINY